MTDKVKLIIEIPKYYLGHPQDYTCLAECVRRGIPLDTVKDWKFYYDHGYAQAKRDLSENKGEWIPVTERLPEPEDKQEVKVVVSYENEDGEFVEKGVFNKRYGFNFPSVKAWQPLPEPYKGESENKE